MGVLVASEGLCWWVVWDCTKDPLCGQKTRFVGCGGTACRFGADAAKFWRSNRLASFLNWEKRGAVRGGVARGRLLLEKSLCNVYIPKPKP